MNSHLLKPPLSAMKRHPRGLRISAVLTGGTLMLILTGVASAAEYHVSQTGSDANPGTATQPWRTLLKANAVVNPGDTVFIGAGQWTDNVIRMRAGEEGKPITWVGQGMDQTLNTRFVPASFTHIKNMHLTWQVDTRGHQVLVENVRFTWTGGRQVWVQPISWDPGGPAGVVVRGCEFIGCGEAAAVSFNGIDGLIENCFFTTSNGGDAIYLNGRRNVVRGCTFKDWNRPAGSTQHTDLFQTFSNNGEVSMDHVIENNLMIDCNGTQIANVTDMAGKNLIRGWTWRNNVFIRVSNPINLYAQDFSFHNNTFYRTPYGAGSCVLLNVTSTRGAAHKTRFFNNIFYKSGRLTTSAAQGYYGLSTGTQNLSGFEADYNLVIGEGGGTQKNGMWWRFGANLNSLNGVDPLFVNGEDPVTPADLALLPGSPARGAGKNLSGMFETDFYGKPRGVRWDIGALTSEPADGTNTGGNSRSRRFEIIGQ